MRSNGIKIGKIFGIEIFIDYSWFFVFVLITWLLATKFYPTFNPNSSLWLNLFLGLITSLLFFSSTLIHELAHSVIANGNGLKVNKITLFLFGGIAELFEEPLNAKVEFKVAIAGPLTSIFLALLFFLAYLFIKDNAYLLSLILLTSTLAQINLLLAIFNLLPGFPLDGGRILRSIIWSINKDLKESTRIATVAGRAVSLAIIFTGVLRVITTDFFGGIWLVLIGLFLYQAAGQSYLELLIRTALEKVRVGEIMNKNIITVSPFLTVNDLIEEYFLKYNYTALPVVVDNAVVGIVSLDDVRGNAEEMDETTRVHEVMKRFETNIFLSKEDEVLQALKKMIASKINFVSVRDNDRLVGILTIDDIAKYLSDKKVI